MLAVASVAFHPLRYSDYDIKSKIKEDMGEKWKAKWLNTTNNKLRELEEVPGLFVHKHLNKKEQVTITRLRIGHTRYTHQFLFNQLDPPPPIVNSANV